MLIGLIILAQSGYTCEELSGRASIPRKEAQFHPLLLISCDHTFGPLYPCLRKLGFRLEI